MVKQSPNKITADVQKKLHQSYIAFLGLRRPIASTISFSVNSKSFSMEDDSNDCMQEKAEGDGFLFNSFLKHEENRFAIICWSPVIP